MPVSIHPCTISIFICFSCSHQMTTGMEVRVTHTASATSPGPRPVQAFRATCDNCAKSKVRCGKEQPSCQRCTYQRVRCVYSPSQRSKKRRQLSNAGGAEGQCPTTPSTGVDRQVPTAPASPPQNDGENTSSTARLSTANSSTCAADLFNFENNPGFFSPLSLPDVTREDSIARWNYTGVQSPVGTRASESPLDVFSDLQSNAQWLQNRNSKDSTTLNDSNLTSLLGSADDDMMEMYVPAESSPGLACHTGVHKMHQACTSVALSTLQNLDIPGAPCAALHSDTTANRLRRSFDTVLKINQTAIDNVQAILSCICTGTTNQALLATAIISQTFSWYEACLERSCNPGSGDYSASATNGDPTAAGSSSSSSSNSQFVNPSHRNGTSSLTLQGMESVFMPPITIGGLQLEAEYGARVVAQVILAELIKMGKVMNAFAEKFCSTTSPSACKQNGETQLHFALEMFLQTRLKMMLRAARERLDRNKN